MEDFVDIAFIEIDAPSVKKELQDIVNFNVHDGRPLTKVNTMNRLGAPRGYRHGSQDASWDLESAIAMNPEVDWRGLLARKEKFNLTYEEGPDGRRYQLLGCAIETVEPGHNESGESVLKVQGQALRHVPVPGTGILA